jgi:hypothetical protein
MRTKRKASAEISDKSRREFLRKAGKLAVYTPPAMMLLMQPSLKAVAASGKVSGPVSGPVRDEREDRSKESKKEKGKKKKTESEKRDR